MLLWQRESKPPIVLGNCPWHDQRLSLYSYRANGARGIPAALSLQLPTFAQARFQRSQRRRKLLLAQGRRHIAAGALQHCAQRIGGAA